MDIVPLVMEIRKTLSMSYKQLLERIHSATIIFFPFLVRSGFVYLLFLLAPYILFLMEIPRLPI